MPANNRILVVDDDKDDLLLLLDILKELYPSYQCNAADNGQAELDYIKHNPPPPGYVFLDLNMLFVNGFEFLKEFSKDKTNHENIVIIYSTSTHPRDKIISKELGAHHYIPKMSNVENLKTKLKTVIMSA
jgi:DNA-binding response OmpR family regulator